MSLVGFRIRSDAAEYVDDFVVYMDQIRYMTHALSVVFDGFDMLTNDFSDAEVGGNAGVKSSSEAK